MMTANAWTVLQPQWDPTLYLLVSFPGNMSREETLRLF